MTDSVPRRRSSGSGFFERQLIVDPEVGILAVRLEKLIVFMVLIQVLIRGVEFVYYYRTQHWATTYFFGVLWIFFLVVGFNGAVQHHTAILFLFCILQGVYAILGFWIVATQMLRLEAIAHCGYDEKCLRPLHLDADCVSLVRALVGVSLFFKFIYFILSWWAFALTYRLRSLILVPRAAYEDIIPHSAQTIERYESQILMAGVEDDTLPGPQGAVMFPHSFDQHVPIGTPYGQQKFEEEEEEDYEDYEFGQNESIHDQEEDY